MKIKCRKIAVFGMLAGVLCLALAGCGASFCGYPLAGKDEMVFACAEGSLAGGEAPPAEVTPSDGETLPAEDEPSDGKTPPDEETPPAEEAPPTGEVSGDGLVDLNSAGAEELMTLNGIGETRAAAIIQFREQNGPFASIEEIMMIPGIKEGIFSRIKDQIVVR